MNERGMYWKPILTAVVFIAFGYWLHAMYPSLLKNASGGVLP